MLEMETGCTNRVFIIHHSNPRADYEDVNMSVYMLPSLSLSINNTYLSQK